MRDARDIPEVMAAARQLEPPPPCEACGGSARRVVDHGPTYVGRCFSVEDCPACGGSGEARRAW